jgi:hypothetical protein
VLSSLLSQTGVVVKPPITYAEQTSSIDTGASMTSDAAPSLDNSLLCFANIGAPSFELAFPPTLFAAMMGHDAVPSSSVVCNDVIDLSDVKIPLNIFLAAIHVTGEGDLSQLRRREGHSLFLSRYFTDGDRFQYSSNNLTHSSYSGESIMNDLKACRMPAPIHWNGRGAAPTIRMTSKCGYAHCPAEKSLIVSAVDPISDSSPTSSLSGNHENYVVVCKQTRIGKAVQHEHHSGFAQSRGQLAYDAFDPKISFVQNPKTKLLVKKQEVDKVAVRCDFTLLPLAKRPQDQQLRQPHQSIAAAGKGRPTAVYEQQLHSNAVQLGSNFYSSATHSYTLGQAKSKIFIYHIF